MSTLSAHLRRLALAAVLLPCVAHAQSLDARRMAMGGVAVGGTGNSGNVAYVAVPEAKGYEQGHSLALPFGMIQFLANMPELDPNNSNFNAFELANLLYNPPWNIQLIQPSAPSGDVTISIAKNSLAVDLEELHDIFPKDGTQFGGVASGAGVAYGIGNFSIGVGPLFHDQNDLILNGPLHDALADGKPFVPNTSYLMHDDGRGQAAMALQAAYAHRLLGLGDPHEPGGWGIYAGGRAKLLRGLAYGDIKGDVGFTTPDTLFGNSSVVLDYHALMRTAGPDDGGMGYGLDLGTVVVLGGTEVGLGLNNVSTHIQWRTLVREAYRDTAGNYVEQDLARDQRFTSTVPMTMVLNASHRFGPTLIAADAVQGILRWSAHAGSETWFGKAAVRGGLTLDQNRILQYSCGSGLRLGRIGFDAALATNSRNLSRQRGLELGLGLTVY